MTDDLIKGAADFKHYHYGSDNDLMSELVKAGQDPKYFIISCIDSRCNPGTIFRAKPGIFFAHKAMGAIVRPYEKGTALAAALQFALNYNKVETVIVLGHTKCGAIQALVNNIEDDEISSFIEVAQHALKKAKSDHKDHNDIITMAEKEVILESTENLRAYPAVAKALKENRINVKSWLFDIVNGNLSEYDEDSKEFQIVNAQANVSESRTK